MDVLALPARAPNDCLLAAERLRERLSDLACRVVCTEDPSRPPYDFLPVDEFLFSPTPGKRRLKIVLKPRKLGDELWTESVAAFVYAGIERAFTNAGLLPAENRPGHLRELKQIRQLVEEQMLAPNRPVEKHFAQKVVRTFRAGVLDDRRRLRFGTLKDISQCSPSNPSDLERLRDWIDQDLEDERLHKNGRPSEAQKIVFAADIANLWSDLTGRGITRGRNTRFVLFLSACWKSGFDAGTEVPSFAYVVRKQIHEVHGPFQCRRCECCRNGQNCDRKRYFGALK